MNSKALVPFLLCSFSTFAASPPEPKFRAVDVDTKVGIGYGLAIADVDGDKKLDICSWIKTSSRGIKIRRAEARHRGEVDGKDHVCIAAADIDGDGKAEVAVGAEWNPGDTQNSGAVFYLIAPKDGRRNGNR